jgi:hypothetical protein
MTRVEVAAQIRDRRADHLGSGPLSRACFDARCIECGLGECTCGCHHPHCPRCGSRTLVMTWAAMDASDWDGWRCLTCDRTWASRDGATR